MDYEKAAADDPIIAAVFVLPEDRSAWVQYVKSYRREFPAAASVTDQQIEAFRRAGRPGQAPLPAVLNAAFFEQRRRTRRRM
jgi:hypothetical protein